MIRKGIHAHKETEMYPDKFPISTLVCNLFIFPFQENYRSYDKNPLVNTNINY